MGKGEEGAKCLERGVGCWEEQNVKLEQSGESQMITTKINVKQLDWVLAKGEHRISIDVAKAPDLGSLWTFAESIGFQPELAAIAYPSRLEVHLLLLHEQLPPGTVLGLKSTLMIERLAEVGIRDDAIRHCYGGEMAAE